MRYNNGIAADKATEADISPVLVIVSGFSGGFRFPDYYDRSIARE
ncbi:MAG TPA: hypothetical protein VM146_05100 [Steroidobacteraceae bacterium]|nr:hypothetical protein [Steroidobacteraceae bacterium]